MRTHHFLRRLDHNRIVQAIKKAEGKSSGQIRVFVQRWKFEEDALPRAQKKFLQLGMQKTRDRNAVLIFVAPRAHKYAVVGDVGVHEKSGEEFWKKLVHDMRAHFKNEDFKRAARRDRAGVKSSRAKSRDPDEVTLKLSRRDPSTYARDDSRWMGLQIGSNRVHSNLRSEF
ncbi:MAG: hypothetical protein DME46_12525 [Verrucomicrobia bacterium]|nr:MAG: hypothetical protein DME46_12525 [Verrucomicrobiota bacterium]